MSGSVEVVLWLHEYELKALDKHLASNGTDVEKRMQEMLADLYSECVPFEERQAIQERINAEHAEAVADQMANTTWAAYHITGHGEDLYFKTVPFPVSWTVKMKKKQKETQDILSYHTQAAGCSDKARAKASGGRQPIEECGRTGL